MIVGIVKYFCFHFTIYAVKLQYEVTDIMSEKYTLKRYADVDEYKADVLDIMLKDEVRNNLLISILVDGTRDHIDNWFMATVSDDHDKIVLIALCTKPFPLLLCELSVVHGSEPVVVPESVRHNGPVEFLAEELRRSGFMPSGVLAVDSLAGCFADAFCDVIDSGADADAGTAEASGMGVTIKQRFHMTMILMKLEKLAEYTKASGFCRMLNESDLSYTPYWENAFCIDCRVPVYTILESEKRIKTRLGMNIHYIWQDNVPVAQAVLGRNTPNGAAISWVYTPVEFRGKGYATSVVAELSKAILGSGKSFCCLFADASNPASCAVYHKLGYYDVCRFDDIKFEYVP